MAEIQRRKNPIRKQCKICKNIKTIKDFYVNKDWKQEKNCDCMCKECASLVKTKELLVAYCDINHRQFFEKKWLDCLAKANNNEEQACSTYIYSQYAWYLFVPERNMSIGEFKNMLGIDESSGIEDQLEESPQEIDASVEEEQDTKVYSAKFSGTFTEKQIKYLENYYNSLVKENGIEDVSDLDYAKKIAKASMHANELQDLYASGGCSLKAVTEALSLFDMLSKSANLAACKKKQKETTLTDISVGEMVLDLIKSNHFCNKKIEWEKDDVDKTVEQFLHLFDAMNPGDM